MLKQLMEANHEIDRMVDHWIHAGKGMSKKELSAAIGHELEMLEYTPAHVEAVLPQIVDRVKAES